MSRVNEARKHRDRVKQLEQENLKWVKPGLRVHYHSVIGEGHDGFVFTVESTGFMCGSQVAWLKGRSGCVSIAALSKAVDL